MYPYLLVSHSLVLLVYKHLDPERICLIRSSFLERYANFQPKIGLITIIVTMMAGLLAISLPSVVTGIARILDRYQSEVISRILQQSWEYKISIYSGMAVILSLCILGIRIENSAEITGIWKIIYYLNSSLFLIFVATFFRFFFSAIKYSNNSKYILQEFANSNREIVNVLSNKQDLNNKKLNQLQTKLLDNLEGIGDVLAFLSSRPKYNLLIIEQLNRLSLIAIKLIDLNQQYPERFAKLSFSDRYRELLNQQDSDSQLEKLISRFDPENFPIFSSLINQIARIHQQAFINHNLKIMLKATRFVTHLLGQLTLQPNLESIIEYYLGQLYYQEFDCDGEEDLEHEKTIGSYFEIVFQEKFRFEYLPLLDQYLFEQFKYIVRKNRVESIFSLSSKATSGIYVVPSNRFDLFAGYEKFGSTKRNALIALTNEMQNIRLESEICTCYRNFYRLAKLDVNKRDILRYKREFYISAIEYYKYNHLRDLIFALGAYCVYRRNFSLIHELWQYNQPEDSSATNLSSAIALTKYGELLNLYFGASLEQRTAAINWDRNHGKERYYHLYLILCLIYSFSTPTGKKADISKAALAWNRLTVSKLKRIEFDIGRISNSFKYLKRYSQNFADLHLSYALVNYIATNKVKPLLERIRQQIPKEIKRKYQSAPISERKVRQFKLSFPKHHRKYSQLRDLYTFYNNYLDLTHQVPRKPLSYFGFSSEIEKDAFLKKWYDLPSDRSDEFARTMANREDKYAIAKWLERCIKLNDNSLNSILNRASNLDKMIVIVDPLNHQQLMQLLLGFNFKFNRVENAEFPQLFSTYSQNKIQIPIIYIPMPDLGMNKIFVLNRQTMGNWKQYCPLECPEDSLDGIFQIAVNSIAGSSNLQQYCRNKCREWLADNNWQPQQQQDWLNSLVQVKIYQKFDLEMNDDFEGYFMELKD